MEDGFSKDRGWGGGFGMIQARYIYCALYFCYYYISPTSDHQALDPGGGGPFASTDTMLFEDKWSPNGLVPLQTVSAFALYVPNLKAIHCP